jgi:hypothetical protein
MKTYVYVYIHAYIILFVKSVRKIKKRCSIVTVLRQSADLWDTGERLNMKDSKWLLKLQRNLKKLPILYAFIYLIICPLDSANNFNQEGVCFKLLRPNLLKFMQPSADYGLFFSWFFLIIMPFWLVCMKMYRC